ncbi:hypothetical protein HGB13_04545 [bacterium]|nr:hypothetical protein [bacterium]
MNGFLNKYLIRLFAVLSLFYCIFSCILGIKSPIFILDETQVLYLFSTSAQVIAGIFGLTITGYIFLRNELDRQKLEDETVTDAVDALKKKYFVFTKYITVLSITTILFSLTTISIKPSSYLIIATIAVNISQSLLAVTLFGIAFFIYDILRPDKIERISNMIQKSIERDSTSERGSIEEFLLNFNTIERLLDKYKDLYLQNQVIDRNRLNKYGIPKSKIVEFFYKNELIDNDTRSRLLDLIRFRNSLIHGTELSVSKHIVQEAKNLLDKLQSAIDIKNSG